MEAVINFASVQEIQKQKTEADHTLNTFNYFCVVCLRSTLYDNKGNFATCQECGIYGSNFGATCISCNREEQYVFWRADFETGKGDTPATAVCAKCTGATLWSNEASQVQGNCKMCLKETTMNDYGVLQECTECSTVVIPQSHLKTVVCPSCPASVLKRQAEQDERSQKYFLIKAGEMKCEDCFLQIVFAEKVADLKKEQRESEAGQGWQLPEEYQYFCITCKNVTSWRNSESGKLSSCTRCGTRGTNKKKRCGDCHEFDYLYLRQGNASRLCAECMSGYGPKGVSDIVVVPCLFCDGQLATFYIFREKGKMRCTECKGLRPLNPPLVPDQCPSCFNFVEGGMKTFSGISRCDDCFRTQLAIGASKTKTADQQAVVSNQTYMHECDFCEGSEKQVWINLGQFSQCQGCQVVGTNSYDVQCQCGEYDYLFTKLDQEQAEAMCSRCHMAGTSPPDESQHTSASQPE